MPLLCHSDGSTLLTLQLCSLRSEPSFDTESQDEVQGRRQGDPEFIEGSPSLSEVEGGEAKNLRNSISYKDEILLRMDQNDTFSTTSDDNIRPGAKIEG
jgi:hypothetical protein